MQNNPIGVFDSGIGGLSVLEALRKALPNEDFFYFGDSKNNPYGEKSQTDLEKIVSNIVQELTLNQHVKMIVIACNTATTKCINFLRKKYPETIFIGTEPAIKIALDSKFKNILVMATPGTIKSDRTKQLIKENQKSSQKITLLPCRGLAAAIEKSDQKTINDIFKSLRNQHHGKNYDAVVLGCTHYVLIQDKIHSFFSTAKLINGNKEIANHAKTLLKENNILSQAQKAGKIEYFYSK